MRHVLDSDRVIFESKIRRLAYDKWEKAGKPIGDGVSFWLEAEKEQIEKDNWFSDYTNSEEAIIELSLRY